MKEKVLEILNKSAKSLDAIAIMKKMKDNYTSEELRELLNTLDMLCEEALVVQRKDNCYMPFERSKFLKGKIEITKKGNGFLLLDGKDLFIGSKRLKNALNGDTVICEIVNEKNGKYEGRVVKVIERHLNGSLGEITVKDGKVLVKLIDEALPFKTVLENYEDLNLVDGEIVKLQIDKEVGETLYVSVKSKIGHKNSPDIDTLKIVAEFNIPTEFSEEVLKEVESIPNRVLESDLEGRRCLRSEEIFTIDGSDTKDIDDAISLKILPNNNYMLGVHIADVSHYVREGSALKKEAMERGNSVYLADRVIPMLPVELSNGICSLNPNVDRCAVSCLMEIDQNGNVVNSEIFKSVINSRKKMTYEQVNLVFEGLHPEGYEEFEKTLLKMLELSKILKENKKLRGEINFISSEVKLKVDEDGKVLDVLKRTEGLGENMIEDFMVVANETVSTTMTRAGVPSIYRVHGSPSPKKIKEFIQFVNILGHKLNGKINYDAMSPRQVQQILVQLENKKEYAMLNKKLLRCMQKAVYDYTNIGHFGLASQDYTHFTSPIRRFSDLYLHYIIDEFIFKKNRNTDFIDYINNSLPYITDHVSVTERNAEECEYEVNDMKIAEYMEGITDEEGNVIKEGHIGQEYSAVIDGMLKNGFFVETDNLINGFVKLETLEDYYTFKEELLAYIDKKKRIAFRLGDKVEVKCIAASKEERTVDFTLVKRGEHGINQQKSKI